MSITTCPCCGALYQESSEEAANRPDRMCSACWSAQANKYRARVPPPEKHTPGTCRTCGAEIQWVKTAAGKNMPVNAETWEPGDEQFDHRRHISHFATCAQAAQHRRAR